MIATVFLVVLIAALALGNVFLSLASPRRLQNMMQLKNETEEQPGIEEGPFQPAFQEGTVDRERAMHLAKRIDRLEQLLLKINKSKFLSKKLNGTNLSQKLTDLDQFKQNTKLEIAALRQRLDKLQPEKRKPKTMAGKISDKKLRDLVFRAR